jgi:hypothetical protein
MIFYDSIGDRAVHTAESQSKTQQSPENQSFQDFFFSCEL